MTTINSPVSSVNQSIRSFNTAPVVRSAAERGVVPTPPTDRGVDHSHNSTLREKVVFSVDTIRFTVHCDRSAADPLLALLGVFGGLEVIGHGGTGFRVIEAGLNGFQLYSDPVDADHEWLSFNLPSKFLQSLGHDKFMDVYQWLCEKAQTDGLRWKFTRFDLAFDQQEFITAQFVDAWAEGDVKTRAEAFKEIDSNEGHTFYLGARQSEAMLRVYDKSDGNSFGDGVGFTRIELELKGDRAMLGGMEVLAAPINQQHLMAAALLNGFCDVSTDWWQDFKLTAKTAWLKLRSSVSTVAKIEAWVSKSVLPSLATLIVAKSGGDLDDMYNMFQRMVGDGKRRWSSRHVKMVSTYQAPFATQFVGAV